MADTVVKFPRTPHLTWLGDRQPRGDKLLDAAEAKALLRRQASVEEKVDGANLGLSIGPEGRLRAQSRGHFLEEGAEGQWKPLWRWLSLRREALAKALGPNLILFGEWCYAEHSVSYDALPDWFLAFDIYDRPAGKFWSRERRDHLVKALGLAAVPLLSTGVFTIEKLRKLIGRSRLGSADSEGLYIRWDEGDWLVARAKIVQPGWVLASEEHWSARSLRTNRLVAPTPAMASARSR